MSLVANSRYKLVHEPPPLRSRPARPAQAVEQSPLEWAEANAQIVHPVRGRIAFTPYPYQADFLRSYYAPRRIVLKARQIGFSQVFALEALYTATTQDEQTILLVSRSQDLAVNLLRYCYLTYNNLKSAPELRKANESEMGFSNGSRIKSIPANRSTGRGFAANAIYLDEFAYAEYAEEIYQSVTPAVSQGGYLTIGSTPNGIGNLYHQLWVSGDGFTRMRVPWYRCPAYNEGFTIEDDDAARNAGEAGPWYQKERENYTSQSWAAEFDCDFVGSGDVVFQQTVIDAAEVGAVGDQEPQDGHDYVMSADLGRRQDATVINVVDATERPYQRVYHERLERAPFPYIQQRLETVARYYRTVPYIESNGIGDPVIENLDIQAHPFVTTARSKVQAIQHMVLLLEQGDYKARWTAQERRELSVYVYDDRKLVQDCVMSLVIGASALASRLPDGADLVAW